MQEGKLEGVVVVSFLLGIPEGAIRLIFKDERFTDLGGPKPQLREASAGAVIGPPLAPVATIKDVRIDYAADRGLLLVRGPVGSLPEVCAILPGLFEKQGYLLSNMVLFSELSIPLQPVVITDAVNWVRSNVKVARIEKLTSACGVELKPFTLSLSNPDTPLGDEWLNIVMQPDVNSPHHRLLVQITKRTKSFDKLCEFTSDVERIIESIRKTFEGGMTAE